MSENVSTGEPGDPDRPSSPTIEAAALQQLLDEEIRRAEDEATRKGWTPWALAGAVAAAAWMLLDLQHDGTLQWRAALCCALVFSAVWDIGAELHVALSQDTRANLAGPRFLWPWHKYHSRTGLVVVAARALFLLIVSYECSSRVPYAAVLVLYLWYGLVAMVPIVRLIQSHLAAPVVAQDYHAPMALLFVALGFALAVGLGLAGYAHQLLQLPSSALAATVKAGMLLAVLPVLLVSLAYQTSSAPFLLSLIGIRRSLVLGRLDPNAAASRIGVAFYGMRAIDVVQEEVHGVLTDLDTLRTEVLVLAREAEAKVEEAEAGGRAPLFIAAFRSLDRARRLEEVGKQQDAIAVRKSTLAEKMMRLIVNSSADDRLAMHRVLDHLDAEANRLRTTLDTAKAQLAASGSGSRDAERSAPGGGTPTHGSVPGAVELVPEAAPQPVSTQPEAPSSKDPPEN